MKEIFITIIGSHWGLFPVDANEFERLLSLSDGNGALFFVY